MKSLSLQKKRKRQMNTARLRTELHDIINRVTDDRILQAVHTILSAQATDVQLTKESMDKMLEASENDIQEGRVIDHQDLKKEMLSWSKK
jgi:endonuclease III